MNKKREILFLHGDEVKSKVRKMKLTAILLFIVCISFGNSFSQVRLSVQFEKADAREAIQTIEEKTNYIFLYKDEIFDFSKKVSCDFNNAKFEDVLKDFCDQTNVSYEVRDRQIILKEKDKILTPPLPQQPQKKDLVGTITDKNGLPIPGVSVFVKGTTIGTNTLTDGTFKLSVPDDLKNITVKLIGMKTQDVFIADKTLIEIQMDEETVGLDEVVAVGYGTQKKTSLTAAVSAISGEKIKTVAAGNVSNMLGGKLSGVISSQGTGEPGHDESTVFIRGVGTISGNNQPLIVINGVIGNMDMLNTLNQNSIKSISVLKDAAAVAPYGMAGANGVILVTLKTGELGKPRLSYDMYVGFQNPTRVINRLNSYQYAQAYNAANANMGIQPMFTADQVEGYKRTLDGDPNANTDAYPNTNAFEQYRNKNTPMTSQSFSASGGTETVKYYLNFGYFGQQGMWNTSDRKRYSLVSNISLNVTKTTELSFNINMSKDETSEPGIGGENIMNISQLYLPIDPTVFSNGLLGASVPIPGRNGGLVLDDIIHNGYLDITSTIIRSQIMIKQQLPFIKGLSLTGIVTTTPNYWAAKQWETAPKPYYNYSIETGEYTKVDKSLDPVARLYQRKSGGENYNYVAQANYVNTFGKHTLALLGVVDVTDGNTDYLEGGKKNYVLNIDELNQGSPNPENWTMLNGSSSYFRWIGYIGRLEYNYNSRYYFELSARHDGHYYFAPDHKFGTFPAISLGWRLSEEKFIKENLSFINNLKLRASYGTSGNLASGPFQYLSVYVFRPIGAILDKTAFSALQEAGEPNPVITWEKAKKSNVGFDLTLWNGLLDLTADYFHENRGNMLVSPNSSVSTEYGIGLSQVNDGSMTNHGFDFSLSSNYAVSTDFKISLKADFTYAKNKLLEVYETEATFNNPDRRRTGRPLGTLFGMKADRLFQEADFDATGKLILDTNHDGIQDVAVPGVIVHPGDIKYVDVNGDGKINGEDETVIGKSPFPEIMYGLTPTISYKGLDLSVFMQGAGKYSVQLYEQLTQPFFSAEVNPVADVVTDAWTPENTTARYPRLLSGQRTNNGQLSSWWVWDASYFRIKTIQLGYTLPPKFIDKLGLAACRMYIAGNNMFVFTKVPFIDPEVSANGLARNGQGYGSGAAYPQQRVFQFGLNLTFK